MKTITSEDYIPMKLWAKDHWSTLAYIETVMVDLGGFQVGFDARMRSNRRNFRVMKDECPKPKRVGPFNPLGIPMGPDHGTILNNGKAVANHDDWYCVQDMAAEGLFEQTADDIQPKVNLKLSAKGKELVARLRQHKANGGNFKNFDFTKKDI